jgi:hypothetical protein
MVFVPMDPDLDPHELGIDISELSKTEVIQSSTTTVTIIEAGKADPWG